MGNDSHRSAVTLFALAVIVVVIVAFVTTFRDINTTRVGNEALPGTIGLARPHPPLDRAPGVPLRNGFGHS
jgi:hypothetical protein